MTHPVRTLSIVLLLAALAFGASQGMGHGPGAMGMGPGMMSTPMATTDTLSFLQHMIPHHEEAIASAEALLAATERPELQAMLRSVIETQRDEVERMQGWIGAWYPDADSAVAYEPMMRDLRDGPVADRERAWLEDMIMHHMMAVHEARTLLTLDLSDHPEVADLANDIIAAQMSEMHVMAGWLSDWFGADAMGAMHGGDRMPSAAGMMQRGPSTMQPGAGTMRHGTGMMQPGPGMMQHGPGTMHHGPGTMHHGPGTMHDVPRGMGGARGAPRDVAESLARAFLAGRGGDAVIVEVTGPRVTFEVTYREGDAEGVLLVDALSGDVIESPGR